MTPSHGRKATRRAALIVSAAGTLALGALAAGCGSTPGAAVAQSPTTHSTTTTAGSGAASPGGSTSSAAAYSACMRRNGVSNFPDPDANGRLALRFGPGTGLDPNSAQFRHAQQACRSLAPRGGKTSPQAQRKALEQALAFSQCMRAHGVKNFPDPQAAGGGVRLSIGSNSGIDPNSPQFQAAQRACKNLLPGGKGGPGQGQQSRRP